MPSRGRRSGRKWGQPEHRPISEGLLRGVGTVEQGPNGDAYRVQNVGPSKRTYVCPGCRGQVGPGVAHVVAWPEQAAFGVDQGVEARRHWHTSCWQRGLIA